MLEWTNYREAHKKPPFNELIKKLKEKQEQEKKRSETDAKRKEDEEKLEKRMKRLAEE
jgi:hypothetical protein